MFGHVFGLNHKQQVQAQRFLALVRKPSIPDGHNQTR